MCEDYSKLLLCHAPTHSVPENEAGTGVSLSEASKIPELLQTSVFAKNTKNGRTSAEGDVFEATPMSRKRALCFIDDDPSELSRFKRAVEHRYVVGTGTSLAIAEDDLRKDICAAPRRGATAFMTLFIHAANRINCRTFFTTIKHFDNICRAIAS